MIADNLTFETKIEFDRDKDSASSSLIYLGECIAAQDEILQSILKDLGEDVRTRVRLEEIKTGSIRSVLRDYLENVSPEDIKKSGPKAFLNQFIIEIREKVLEFLSKNDDLNSSNAQELMASIQASAAKYNVGNLISRDTISIANIRHPLKRISATVSHLSPTQHLITIIKGKTYELKKTFRIPEEEEFTQFETRANLQIKFQIKQPDYTGQSRWKIYIDNNLAEAKIADIEWLYKFQNGLLLDIDFPKPQDFILATADFQYVLMPERKERYVINKVLRIIKVQASLPTSELF